MPTPTPEEEINTPPSDDLDQFPQPVQLAVEAAAEEAGVAVEDVRLLGYEERDWPSTALGCPQPGFSYAQVVTPGYVVQLSAGGSQLEYHTNLTSNVVLCSTS